MADISKFLHEHEQRKKGKTEKTGKTEKPRKPAAKKPASRGDLVKEIQRAEIASIRRGLDGQIWFNPKSGEIWTTHFSPADNYLPSEAAGRFILLWETRPKILADVIGSTGALIDGAEGEYYLRQLSEYARGKYSHIFNPVGIADRLIEQKIKPALQKGTKKPAPAADARADAAAPADAPGA